VSKANRVRPLFELPVASTQLLEEPQLVFSLASTSIPLRFEREDMEVSQSVTFEKVRAFRHRAELLCTIWHLQAYDKVVAIDDSDWVEELNRASQESSQRRFVMNHYMLFLADAGAFELVAESVALKEQDSKGR
jgi:hypothetical protein